MCQLLLTVIVGLVLMNLTQRQATFTSWFYCDHVLENSRPAYKLLALS